MCNAASCTAVFEDSKVDLRAAHSWGEFPAHRRACSPLHWIKLVRDASALTRRWSALACAITCTSCSMMHLSEFASESSCGNVIGLQSGAHFARTYRWQVELLDGASVIPIAWLTYEANS